MTKPVHHLYDPSTEKICNLILDGSTFISETGKTGKLKQSVKDFSDEEEALSQFYQKEWDLLRKGFIMKNPEAETGQPTVHSFIGKGFTGCLSIANTGDATAVYKPGDSDNDALVFIDSTGNLVDTIQLPRPLPWNINYHKKFHFLLLDADHFIYHYDLASKEFTQLTSELQEPASFISLSEDRIAYGSHPYSYVKDLHTDTIVYERKFETERYSGHSPQFSGAISGNGNVIAICTHSGNITLTDLITGAEKVISGNFEMIKQMEFIQNDEILLVQEEYGTWGIRFFDLKTLREITFDGLKTGDDHHLAAMMVQEYCLNEDHSKLAVVHHHTAHVFDFNAKKHLHSFNILHTVKTAGVTFIGDQLGVRTDLGCFSIYNI